MDITGYLINKALQVYTSPITRLHVMSVFAIATGIETESEEQKEEVQTVAILHELKDKVFGGDAEEARKTIMANEELKHLLGNSTFRLSTVADVCCTIEKAVVLTDGWAKKVVKYADTIATCRDITSLARSTVRKLFVDYGVKGPQGSPEAKATMAQLCHSKLCGVYDVEPNTAFWYIPKELRTFDDEYRRNASLVCGRAYYDMIANVVEENWLHNI